MLDQVDRVGWSTGHDSALPPEAEREEWSTGHLSADIEVDMKLELVQKRMSG